MKGLAVVAGGLVSAVGFNAAASCAAIRAGIRGAEEANLYHPRTGARITAAKVKLPQWWETTGKLAELAAPAIEECLKAMQGLTRPEEVPIVLCVAGPERPHRFEGLEEDLLEEIAFRLQLAHNPRSGIVAGSQASVALALRHAYTLVDSGDVPACIVAGVDGFLRQKVVEAYIERRRILTEDNSNGFTPGEAASAVLVAEYGRFPSCQLEILGVGFAREQATIEATEPCRAEGLTEAIARAVARAGIDFGELAFRLSDLNGEHYKFKEAMIAIGRMEKRPHHEPFDVWHPIEFIGEVGAAIGPANLTVALSAGRKGYAPGALALHHYSNDDGERVAIVTRFREEAAVRCVDQAALA